MAFRGSNAEELLLNFIAFAIIRRDLSVIDAICAMQSGVQGAYSCVLLTRDALFAIRDPHGFRPLCFGGVDGFWVVASETNALDTNIVDLIDDVLPGEVARFDRSGMSRHPYPALRDARGGREHAAHCVFEYVYFSRPDSVASGQRVYDVPKRIGARLADENRAAVDVVVPVPDSSIAAAMGFAQRAELPFEFGLIRNHYVGPMFISPA